MKLEFLDNRLRLKLPLSAIEDVAIVARKRVAQAFMLFGRNVPAWEVLRVGVENKVHYFAVQHFTKAAAADLEDWLTKVAAAAGLEAKHEISQ
jgi:hypothetical protein